jgi:SAM-dependent methyltransferase
VSAPTERQAAQFFDRYATTFDSLYDGRRTPFWRWMDQRFRSDILIRYLWTLEQLGVLDGGRVLDIGCGSGPYLVEAIRRGAAEVTGVDPAPQMLALARERLKSAGAESKGRLIEGLFPGTDTGVHDFGIVMGVMDYVDRPEEFLAALRPVIRKAVVISFPSTHWFRTPFRKVRYRLRRCPVYFYDEDRIHRLLPAAGFPKAEVRKIPGAGMDYHVCLSDPTATPQSSQ